MKIITTTGFYSTGSSAITDLLMEYNNVVCKSDLEIRILHDPYCVSDLEYNLIENPNRHNSSHSVKRFIHHMKKLDHVWFIKRFSKYFNGKFLPIIEEYINDLSLMQYHSIWHYDVYERSNCFYVLSRMHCKFNRLMHKIFRIPLNNRNLVSKKEKAYLTTTDEEIFLAATKKMMNNLALAICNGDQEFVCFDQLVPPSNISRYERYVDDLKVIVVDRDPRDIYVLEKKIWKGNIIPKDVKEYCTWYKWTRELLKNNPDGDYLFIRFEDLIYKYDETVSKIENYLNLSKENHKNPLTHFNPNKSIANTQVWLNYDEYKDDIEYISNELKDYLYDFPSKEKSNRKDMF
jgi:hypothetical protein